MKKKTIKTLLILVSSLCLYGCGEDAPSVSENTSANTVSQNLVAEKDFYSGDLTSEYGEHLRYELTLLDLSNCYFDQYYINNDGSYTYDFSNPSISSSVIVEFGVVVTIGVVLPVGFVVVEPVEPVGLVVVPPVASNSKAPVEFALIVPS